MITPSPTCTSCPYPTLFRSPHPPGCHLNGWLLVERQPTTGQQARDTLSTATVCLHCGTRCPGRRPRVRRPGGRSEEHTSELQSLRHLVCRFLLEKKSTV